MSNRDITLKMLKADIIMDDSEIKSYRVLVLVPEPGEPNPHPEHQDVRTPLPTAWVKHVYRKNILPQQPQHTKGAFAQLLRLGLSSEVSYVITKQW